VTIEKFRRELAAGEMLFDKGEAGDCAYIIESGAIEILRSAQDSGDVVARLGKRDLFGEMALFGEHTRSAAARAAEPSRLTVVTHDYLNERLYSADPMLRHLLRTLANRCRDLLGSGSSRSNSAEDADLDQAHARIHAEQELVMALERSELLLHLQPINRLDDFGVAGFEALVRWQHPQRGLVSPALFIPLAEESSLINRIGLWIIDQSCAALAQLNALRGDTALFMSINLSGRQLDDPEVLPALERAIAAHGVAPSQLKLEVTESLLLQSLDDALPLLNAARARGMKISLDDFGTGYCSLSYLHQLPLDTLKLDRSFIAQLESNESGRRIVASVIRMAHELGLDVITEGLETKEQIAELQVLGADLGQGYYFSRPVALAQALEIARKSL
jgi:EAL domain-containing protein (putative c-di-GMP-specific phosphodiesterase class I)